MPFTQKLADSLILRSVQNEADKERFATFNTVYNNPNEGATCSCLLHYHPTMTSDDFLIVESDANQEIVSTTCLIPWDIHFCGLELRVAQLEMVLTHPEYRGKGLVRTQINHFEQQVKERSLDMSIIWGIPYYYRQYGYAYTIEGGTAESLPVWKIPDGSLADNVPLKIRLAQLADITTLSKMYNREANDLALAAQRNPEYWKYLLESAKHPVEMLERADTNAVVGYAVLSRSDKTATILENSVPDAMTALALLQHLRSQVTEQIQIFWPQSMPLTALAQQLGSQTVRGGQWLLRIPDLLRFLNKLRPIFEQRLVKSDWSNISTNLTINLFREAFSFCFVQGKLESVDALGFVDSSMGSDGGQLCIPPEAFLRLLFGYRSLDELYDAWPDIIVKPEARSLIDTLFPRLQPFLYTPYHYLGSLE